MFIALQSMPQASAELSHHLLMMEGGEGSSAPMEGAVVSTGSGSDGVVGTAESAGIVVSSGGASLEGAPPLVDEDEALPPAIAIAAGDGQSEMRRMFSNLNSSLPPLLLLFAVWISACLLVDQMCQHRLKFLLSPKFSHSRRRAACFTTRPTFPFFGHSICNIIGFLHHILLHGMTSLGGMSSMLYTFGTASIH